MIAHFPRGRVCLALGAILLGSLGWAQSRGTAEDESAIKALMQSMYNDDTNATKAKQYAADADLTNALGRRIHGREAISQWFDGLVQNADFKVGVESPASRKVDVRFVRPDVAVVYANTERVGQIDPATKKAMPARKIHIQYVLSKEDGKWLIQAELIMDEEHGAKQN